MSGDDAAGRPAMSDDYARVGFGSRIGFGDRPVVLVVDMVRAYLVEGEPLWTPEYRDVLEANQRLLAAARAGGVPVVWTTLHYPPQGHRAGWFMTKVPALRDFEERPDLGRFHSELAPLDEELVVRKQFASAFFGTDLDETLRAQNVDTVLVTGVSTSGCVRATALDALQHGYRPVVVAEAVGDRDEGAHRQSLYDLQAKYADVEPLQLALEQLERRDEG